MSQVSSQPPKHHEWSRRLMLSVMPLALITLAFLSSLLDAQPDDLAKKKEGAERLEEMRRRAQALNASLVNNGKRERVELVQEPLLRYSDPARETSDGSLWVWGRKGRPVALLSLFYEPLGTGRIRMVYELVSLSRTPVVVDAGPRWTWTPRNSGLEIQAFPEAPEPAATSAARLRQMKQLAQRFTASERSTQGEEYQLRLLPQPIHRYDDTDAGLVDGSFFVFAYGTNPEILLVIECQRRESSPATWQYGAARLSVAELTLKVDDHEVYHEPHLLGVAPADPYFGADEMIER